MRMSMYPGRSRSPVRPRLLIASRLFLFAGLFLALFAAIGIVQVALAEPSPSGPAAPAMQGAENGQKTFNAKCAGCHSIGRGKLVGPDLKDVTKRRDTEWIKRFISDPAKMIASDPVAKQVAQENAGMTMPTLGLSPKEIDEVVEYLANPGAVPAAPAGGAAVAGLPGNAVTGQRIFLGEVQLANGGTPCVACHTVSGAGSLGGGALGPDLTHVVQRLTQPGLSAALQTIAFPTMLGPFQNRPLTAQEQADLVSFLMAADLQQPPVLVVAPGAWTINALLVFSISLGGALILFGLLLWTWMRVRRRRTDQLPVRRI